MEIASDTDPSSGATWLQMQWQRNSQAHLLVTSVGPYNSAQWLHSDTVTTQWHNDPLGKPFQILSSRIQCLFASISPFWFLLIPDCVPQYHLFNESSQVQQQDLLSHSSEPP